MSDDDSLLETSNEGIPDLEQLRITWEDIPDVDYKHPTEIQRYFDYDQNMCSLLMTITLKPKMYKFNSITQFELTRLVIQDILESSCIKYMSIAELTVQGNVHYHVVVKSQDKMTVCHVINRLKRERKFGHMHFSQIKCKASHERACNYLLKDLQQTKKVLHTQNFKPNILNLKI